MVSSYGGADKVPISKELVLRARKSNAAYKEDLRKAEEKEKARLATREREKEDAARKKAAEANTEKWEKKVQDLQGKIKAKKAFIEEQNNIQKTAHAKGEKMKSTDALKQHEKNCFIVHFHSTGIKTLRLLELGKGLAWPQIGES